MHLYSALVGAFLVVFALLALRARHIRMVMDHGSVHFVPAGGRTYAASLIALLFASTACWLFVHQHTEEEAELDVRTANLDKRAELYEHPPVRMGRVGRIVPTTRFPNGDEETLFLELSGEEDAPAPYQISRTLPGLRGVRSGDFVLIHTDEDTRQVLAVRKLDFCAPVASGAQRL